MKLDRLTSSRSFVGLGAALVATVALACGCSSSLPSSGPARTASAAPQLTAEAADVAGTTNLMSARLAGPAPKVGKAHLAIDDMESADDIESGGAGSSELDAPKEGRRSDGSRRGGGFGSSK